MTTAGSTPRPSDGEHGRTFYYECSVPNCTLDGHKPFGERLDAAAARTALNQSLTAVQESGIDYDGDTIRDLAKVGYVVYAVNHIEAAEADLAEALRLLERWCDLNMLSAQELAAKYPDFGGSFAGEWDVVYGHTRAFLDAHPAPQGEVEA